MLKINEIFFSIQGEGSNAGLPCIFIRLTYCNLRCSYCDTEYAFHEGVDMSIDEIMKRISEFKCTLVEVTGGEPLIQEDCIPLLQRLCDQKYDVMLETGGSLSIANVDKRVKNIVDLKCPTSNMEGKNYYENIKYLKPNDEIKFVIGNREDYEWSKDIIKDYELDKKCTVLFSCVFGKLENRELVEWILEDNLKVRFQTQLHKYIWEPDRRGV